LRHSENNLKSWRKLPPFTGSSDNNQFHDANTGKGLLSVIIKAVNKRWQCC